ncbi:hypothetical protein VT03_14245 [Planctomyces sp. SH-PL14]|nr:hypothetical protein VT03_14245 [Planctomyces sp. SH-PL14]
MTREIIVTDLTRFTNGNIVCTAGVDSATGMCIRPMPYLPTSECVRLNILPGAKLTGNFTLSQECSGPHQEDHNYDKLTFHGPSTSDEFKMALRASLFSSVSEGFEVDLPPGQKCLPPKHIGPRSIITVSVAPRHIQIIDDAYKAGKIKLNFTDNSGQEFRFLPITDLGFHNYASDAKRKTSLDTVNSLIHTQKEVYVRIGLSRVYTAPNGVEGYWLQANGIYTFPEFNEQIRSYR